MLFLSHFANVFLKNSFTNVTKWKKYTTSVSSVSGNNRRTIFLTYACTEIVLHSFPVSSLPSIDQDGSMSQYTSEYLQEKLQKELNPIHLVRSTGLVLFKALSDDLYFTIGYFNCLIRQLIWGNASMHQQCPFPPPGHFPTRGSGLSLHSGI